MRKKVNLSISGKQPDITDGDEIKLVTDASYSYINNRHFVKYEEIHEGSVKIKTLIKFDKNSFEISKCGAVNTNMVFEVGKIHKGTYRTPFIISSTRIFLSCFAAVKRAFISPSLSLALLIPHEEPAFDGFTK